MKSFPKRYAVYLAAIAYLAADYQFRGPLTRSVAPSPKADLGPVAARAYGMPLPESALQAAILHHRTQRGLPTTAAPSHGLRLRTTDSLLANAIVRTWVKDEGTFFPGTDPIEREDAWLVQKLAPALEVTQADLATFTKDHPKIPQEAARQYLTDQKRASAIKALQREILKNASENTQR